MDGHISRQSSSYRQGLVLGLTMAEIMILLIFCLLITTAAVLKKEQTKPVKVWDNETMPMKPGARLNSSAPQKAGRSPSVRRPSRYVSNTVRCTASAGTSRADQSWTPNAE